MAMVAMEAMPLVVSHFQDWVSFKSAESLPRLAQFQNC